MKLFILIIVSALTTFPLAVSAKENQVSFLRQIDKPLQDPSGVRRFSFDIAGEKRLHYDTLSIQLSPGFSYAITDRVTFCDLPWPMLQVSLKASRAGTTASDGLSALALSLRAGVASTFLASAVTTADGRLNGPQGYWDDYIRVLSNAGVLAKIPLSRSFWAQCDLTAQIVGDEAIQGYVYPRIGYQVTNFFYAMIGYRGGFFRFFDEYRPYSTISYLYRYSYSLDYYQSSDGDKSTSSNVSYSSCMPVAIGIDIGRKFSTIVATSIGKKVGKFVPVEVQFQVNW
jgi:hypothetical protein